MASSDYESNVFINCPFDDAYRPLFHAVVFAVHDAGFRARCALELSNAVENRLAKILRIIEECRYGVHDLSRTELSAANNLPRFNMPLELGLFLGYQKAGNLPQRRKNCLVLDKEPYRYQQFISDLSGQDVFSHDGSQQGAIREVRNWLAASSKRPLVPGGDKIHQRFQAFESGLPDFLSALHITADELTFVDYQYAVADWLKLNLL